MLPYRSSNPIRTSYNLNPRIQNIRPSKQIPNPNLKTLPKSKQKTNSKNNLIKITTNPQTHTNTTNYLLRQYRTHTTCSNKPNSPPSPINRKSYSLY